MYSLINNFTRLKKTLHSFFFQEFQIRDTPENEGTGTMNFQGGLGRWCHWEINWHSCGRTANESLNTDADGETFRSGLRVWLWFKRQLRAPVISDYCLLNLEWVHIGRLSFTALGVMKCSCLIINRFAGFHGKASCYLTTPSMFGMFDWLSLGSLLSLLPGAGKILLLRYNYFKEISHTHPPPSILCRQERSLAVYDEWV